MRGFISKIPKESAFRLSELETPKLSDICEYTGPCPRAVAGRFVRRPPSRFPDPEIALLLCFRPERSGLSRSHSYFGLTRSFILYFARAFRSPHGARLRRSHLRDPATDPRFVSLPYPSPRSAPRIRERHARAPSASAVRCTIA